MDDGAGRDEPRETGFPLHAAGYDVAGEVGGRVEDDLE